MTTVDWQAPLQIVHPARPAFSPDGTMIACAVEAAYTLPGAAAQSHIWIAAADGSGAREATRGPGADTAPVWSPDGRALAFLSDRDQPGQSAVFLLDDGVGEARKLGEVPGSVEQVRFARDGRTVIALAADPGSDRAGADSATRIGENGGEDPRVRRAAQHWRRLYRIGTATGETTRIELDGINVWEFDWRGGALVAIVSDDPSESGWYAARVVLVDVDAGAVGDLHLPADQVERVALSPDEARVAFIEGFCSDRGLLVGTAIVVTTADGAATRPAPELDVGSLEWRDERSLWFAGQRGLVSTCGTIDAEGGGSVVWDGDASLLSGWTPFASAAPDGGLLAAAYTAWDAPPELRVLDPSVPAEGWRPVTALNSQAEPPRAVCERRLWHCDEHEIEGLVLRPAGAGDAPLPLIVWVHGGPTGAHVIEYPTLHNAALLDAGYAVLLPNPRGSSGRGQPFARANIGDMGGGDLRDILAGVDAIVAAGVADPDRIGIAGGSYGGFMAAWAVTQTDRFRASIPFAAVTDWLSFHNTTNIGRFDKLFLAADPYEAGGEYFHRSPVVHARAVKTPTLVMHGELDLCVPVSQGIEFHHALAEAGVDTELVIYPREGHGWRERDHQLDGCRRMVEWFNLHLRG
jgi:dipeptidyl aminopeptidase/acylaminoacyl peptidase